MFSQIPSPSGSSAQTWAAAITALAGAVAAIVAKKKFSRKTATHAASGPPKPHDSNTITRAEFHEALDSMRDRMDANHVALSEKMDSSHKELLCAITSQGAAVEKRLDALESAVARLDERTKNLPSLSSLVSL